MSSSPLFGASKLVLVLRSYIEREANPWVFCGSILMTTAVFSIGLVLFAPILELIPPLIPVVTVLFGFSVNSLVLLSRDYDEYIQAYDGDDEDDTTKYFIKTISMNIHSLGVALWLIVWFIIGLSIPENLHSINFIVRVILGVSIVYYALTILILTKGLSELVMANSVSNIIVNERE